MLQGLRVLFVEDDVLVNADTTELLERMGCRVTSATNLREALNALAKDRPDVAVLDIVLGRVSSFSLAERLEDLGIPIIFLTGYAPNWGNQRWSRYPRCNKPCEQEEIRRLLTEAAAKREISSVPPTC